MRSLVDTRSERLSSEREVINMRVDILSCDQEIRILRSPYVSTDPRTNYLSKLWGNLTRAPFRPMNIERTALLATPICTIRRSQQKTSRLESPEWISCYGVSQLPRPSIAFHHVQWTFFPHHTVIHDEKRWFHLNDFYISLLVVRQQASVSYVKIIHVLLSDWDIDRHRRTL